jgi:hypothetical protein
MDLFDVWPEIIGELSTVIKLESLDFEGEEPSGAPQEVNRILWCAFRIDKAERQARTEINSLITVLTMSLIEEFVHVSNVSLNSFSRSSHESAKFLVFLLSCSVLLLDEPSSFENLGNT